MKIEWDAPITMDDGVVLRADVFRPADEGRHPVILSYGPYAKGLSFQEGYKSNWARLTKAAPEVLEGSSNKYQCWELVDPEKWVPDGYVCVRVDSRGAGRSPGVIDIWSAREARDFYHCIEWAAAQPWSNGKVGLNAISYFAPNPCQGGARRPANWGGQGLHPRGNYEGFLAAGSREKWLEVHGDTHFTHFYSNYGMGLQKRFFGRFLKGADTGWDQQARVSLNIRRPGERFTLRAENEWPLARTKWTRFFLQQNLSLSEESETREGTVSYDTTGEGLTFSTGPLKQELEITGPLAAKLWLSSETSDADVFVALRVFDPA